MINKELLEKELNKRNILKELKKKRVLLLQGPMGDFFNVLEDILVKNNSIVFRMGLNYGDDWFVNKPNIFKNFYGLLPGKKYQKDNYFSYKGNVEGFSKYIKEFYISNKIEVIFVFGDCRLYQSQAIKKAKKLGIEIYVFEEGYIRPNYITLEKNGVNKYSCLPKNKEYYLKQKDIKNEEPKVLNKVFNRAINYAITYYILSFIGSYKYPHYIHHRNFNPFMEFYYGLKNFIKSRFSKIEDNKISKKVIYNLRKNYFLVPLQTYNDFQIITHSKYNSVEDFINEVMFSYKKNGEQGFLLFKHHPMDRGRKDYRKHINKKKKELGINKKIYVCFDGKLPRLIKNSKGVIQINSTTGMQSMYHKIPTICLGKSFFDFEGLTDQNGLDNFWFKQTIANNDLYEKYRNYLIKHTQLNSSFY